MHHISNFCCVKARILEGPTTAPSSFLVKANCACSMLLSFLCLRKVLTRSSILACIFWVFPSIRVNVSNGLLSGRVILWQLNCLTFSYLKVRKVQKLECFPKTNESFHLFLPYHLKSGQIKKIKEVNYTN